MKREYILCSAIWYKDLPKVKETPDDSTYPININKGIVFCGHRHPHCQYTMIAVTGKRSVTPEVGEYVQGFLTSLNRFVDRKEALIIAENANQIFHNIKLDKEVGLTSEDLY